MPNRVCVAQEKLCDEPKALRVLKSTPFFGVVPMSGFAQRRRRGSRERAERIRDPEDRPGNLRLGAADERLDALLEESKAARAASTPPGAAAAAVRRLAANPRQGVQASSLASTAVQDRGQGDRNLDQGAGGGQQPNQGADGWRESVRQSIEILQRAFGPAFHGAYHPPPPGQGLLAPLFQGWTPSWCCSWFGCRPYRRDLGPQPRVLDPYLSSTPQTQRPPELNLFWCEKVQMVHIMKADRRQILLLQLVVDGAPRTRR